MPTFQVKHDAFRVMRYHMSAPIQPSIIVVIRVIAKQELCISRRVLCQAKSGIAAQWQEHDRGRGERRVEAVGMKTRDFHRMHNFSIRNCVFPLQGSRLARAYYPRVCTCTMERATRTRKW